MNKYLIAAALASLAACGGSSGGGAVPEARPIAIRTCVADAEVRLEGGGFTVAPLHADANGDVTFAAIPGTVTAFNLIAFGAGHAPYQLAAVPLPAGPHQFILGACVPLTDPGLQIALPPWPRTLTDTGERGAVRVDGLRFVRADGTTFPWRGIDGFLLYRHWLSDREGIDPIVEDWLSCGGRCTGRGANVIRVLGMVSWGDLYPQRQPEYYAQLRPFVDHLWQTFHLRVEWVIFADAQIIMPDRSEEDRHAGRVLEAFLGSESVFLEVANEPFKNIPGNAATAFAIGQTLRGKGIPIASGDYETPWLYSLDYITVHGDRGDEWPRKAKDLLDYRNGDFGVDHGGWRGDRPVVGDEPIGFAEVDKPGSRATSADDAAHFAGACQLFAAGCTFHNDAGTDTYGPLGPVQATAAAAFFTTLHFIPPDAQLWGYQRGDNCGDCPGVGNMPVAQWDLPRPDGSLRTFCKTNGGAAYCVAIRQRSPVLPRDGWRIAAQLRAGVVRLER